MAMNPIKFQPVLSMPAFVVLYGTEAKRRRALYRARWPKGFRCPACSDRRRSTFHRERLVYYQCRACQHQPLLIAISTDENLEHPTFAVIMLPQLRHAMVRCAPYTEPGLRLADNFHD